MNGNQAVYLNAGRKPEDCKMVARALYSFQVKSIQIKLRNRKTTFKWTVRSSCEDGIVRLTMVPLKALSDQVRRLMFVTLESYF